MFWLCMLKLTGRSALKDAGTFISSKICEADDIIAADDDVTGKPVATEPIATEPVATDPVANEPVASGLADKEECDANEAELHDPIDEVAKGDSGTGSDEPVAAEPVAAEPVADELSGKVRSIFGLPPTEVG
eukprot:451198_1